MNKVRIEKNIFFFLIHEINIENMYKYYNGIY